jgi:hydroxypyruvate reductase
MDGGQARIWLEQLFKEAVRAADPLTLVPRHLPISPKGRTIVVGAGKASAAMAQAFERAWMGELSGLVVTRYGHEAQCDKIEIVQAAHPVPDLAGAEAAQRMLKLVQGLTEDDLVVALMSGGGSALLSAPAQGLLLEEKQAVNRALLACGASIDEMNCLRKHLSAIKGGRLAAAAFPARVETLIISDVPGDDPSVVASGPTLADPTSFADAREIIARYKINLPASVLRHLEAAEDETPKPGDPRLARAFSRLVATPQMSLQAAAQVARAAGITPVILGDAIEGEASDVARVMAGIAMQVRRYSEPAAAPCVLLSGGETTVTLRGPGRGGRNVEFLLALAVALRGAKNIYALAADTDGIDGAEDVAGAFISPETLERARNLGLSASAMLAQNDAHSFFEKLDAQIITGPTLTNVNDFRAILILPP